MENRNIFQKKQQLTFTKLNSGFLYASKRPRPNCTTAINGTAKMAIKAIAIPTSAKKANILVMKTFEKTPFF